MKLNIFAREAFEFFCERIYGDNEYRFSRSAKATQLYNDFEALMEMKYPSSIGPETIWFYLVFQFRRFEITDFKPKTPFGRVVPNNVFGKAAFDRYVKREQEFDGIVLKSDFLTKYKIIKDEFTKKRKLSFKDNGVVASVAKVILQNDKVQDTSKKQAIRFEDPLDWCVSYNDLYNHRDKSCQVCPDADKCKIKLNELYPQIYKIRGYER